jgi:hypothetical protein
MANGPKVEGEGKASQNKCFFSYYDQSCSYPNGPCLKDTLPTSSALYQTRHSEMNPNIQGWCECSDAELRAQGIDPDDVEVRSDSR